MSNEIELLRSNFRKYLILSNQLNPFIEPEKAQSLLQKDGTLESVDYSSRLLTGTGWTPYNHLLAMHVLLPDRSDDVRKMLAVWERLDPVSDNWWWQEIGTPHWLCRTLILLDEYVQPGSKIHEILSRSSIRDVFTGQNLVWVAGVEVAKGLLYNDESMVKRGRDIINAEITIAENEGLKADWSFHQHGPQPQFGNYGLSWFLDMTMWCAVFSGTAYAFDAEKVKLLENFYLHGQKWMLLRDSFDVNNCGRQFQEEFPQHKYRTISFAAECLRQFGFLQDETPDLYGCKAWPLSGLMMSRRPDFCFSLRMCSRHIFGTECCGQENILGRYAADGATMIYPGYASVQDSLVLRNWRQIPGTTELMNTGDLMPLSRYADEWLWNAGGDCGCWGEGDLGAAWMKQRTECITADKAWFCLRDTVICMGRNISSSKNDTVATTVLQEKSPARLLLNSKEVTAGKTVAATPAEVTAGAMKYIFPVNGNLHINLQEVTSSWQVVSGECDPTEHTGTVAAIYFDHGIMPQNGEYCYMITPADKAAEKVEFINTPCALGIKSPSVTLIAFFEAGSVENITMEKAGLYIAQSGHEIRQYI